ncbi:DNA-(apurinic or apyrimidinic site) endonuclease isoform X3 [Schistocerca nitens]|nr:DNA-(apurinic or apyrimidinic site) endonuclease isoform X3 [Schistocerca nitens]XP_049792955.1 DNA-(apurinic or apyrimidinic site) endonuclease isoform X3 [Schistocerca nitens]
MSEKMEEEEQRNDPDGDSNKEEDEKPQPRSGGRQSMRNLNKTVKYHEDDYVSSDEERRTKARSRKRKTKSPDDDDFEEAEGTKKKARGRKGGGTSRRRSAKDKDKDDDDEDEDEDIEEAPEKATKAKKSRMNRVDNDYDSIDFSSDKTTSDGKPWNLKISSWNVGGLKAWLKKNGLEYIKREKPDIICLQEVRCSEANIPPEAKVEGYHTYWVSGEKEGYAGVALLTKVKPLDVKYGIGKDEHDSEGRLITAEYEKFFVVGAYVPNAGRGLVTLPKRMKWDPDLRAYLKELDAKKPVILCGDMNVSHEAIDLANPKTNTKNAGFTQEERDGMTALLKEGFIDSFRQLYPDKTGAYTFWTYMGNARSRNVGWRLDYFILSEQLKSNVCDSIIRSEVYGSDHCPITLLLHMEQ